MPRLLELASSSARPKRSSLALSRRTLSSTASRFAAASAASRKPPTVLPAPQPMWTWKPDSLQAALTNARKRAAPFTPNDALVLGALRERYAAADTELRASRDAAKAAGEAVRVAMKQGREVAAHIKEEAGTARTRTRELEMEREGLERQALALRMRLPNETSRETPVGDESQARIVRHGGPTNALPPQWHAAWHDAPAAGVAAFAGVEADATRDHVDLLAKYAPAALPTPAAQHVSASGFPHFGEPLASLALALENYALRRARAKGAQLRLVPDVVPSSLVALSGFAPREDDAAQVYTLSAASNDLGLSLAGTAELPLLAMHANRTYAKEELPIFEVALSHSFRAEAGARGRESRGLYRVHQFSKAELFVVCRAEDSGKWLEKLVDLQVEILKPLGLCWRVLDMPTEELGASAFRKYDVEVWMPGRGTWGEVCSASNCTDFQSRRISTRAEGLTKRAFGWAHTLNATAAAIPRLLVAIIETHGFNAAGQTRVPEVLRRHWIGNERDVEWLSFEEAGHVSAQGGSSTTRPSLGGSGHQSRQYSTSTAPPPPPPETRRSVWERSVARVRAAAARSGTDPSSMVLSFALLHELSAILPLFVVFWILSSLGAGSAVLAWLLPPSSEETSSVQAKVRQWVDEGAARAERYGRRKGWFGFEKGSEATGEWSTGQEAGAVLAGSFADAVAAYAIVKALFPLRIAACIALAGPFARLAIEPLKRALRRRKGR